MDEVLTVDNECLFATKKYNTQLILDKIREDAAYCNKILDVHPGRYGTSPTPLHLACYYGRPQIVLCLLNGGANPNAKNGEGVTPLWLTIGYDSQERIMPTAECRWRSNHPYYFYKNYSQIKECAAYDPYTDVAMHKAEEKKAESRPALSGIEDFFICARLLLLFGAKYDLSTMNKCGQDRCFLQDAVISHNFYIARTVFEQCKVLERYDRNQSDALEMAKEILHSGMSSRIRRMRVGLKTRQALMRGLFQNGLDPTACYEGNDMNLIHMMVSVMSKKTIISETNGLDLCVHQQVYSKTTLIPMFDLLKAMNVPTDTEDCYGMTPLHYAIEFNQIPLVQHMLGIVSSRLCVRNCKDNTPLCCIFDSNEFLCLLQNWFNMPNSDESVICRDNLESQIAPYLWMIATVAPYVVSWKAAMVHADGTLCKVFQYLWTVYKKQKADAEEGKGCNIDPLLDLDMFAILAEALEGFPPRKPAEDSVVGSKRYDLCMTKLMPNRLCEWVTAYQGEDANLILTPYALELVNKLEIAYMKMLLCPGALSGDEPNEHVDEYDRYVNQTGAVIETGAWLDSVIRGVKRAKLCISAKERKEEQAAAANPKGGKNKKKIGKNQCGDCCGSQFPPGSGLVQGTQNQSSGAWVSNVDYCLHS